VGHDCERSAFRVPEERHPFLRAIRVFVNHVRTVEEFDTLRLQGLVGSVDVCDTEIQDRFDGGRGRFLRKKQASTAAVKEREFSERIEVMESENLSIPERRMETGAVDHSLIGAKWIHGRRGLLPARAYREGSCARGVCREL
jgi:hypothetical protein